MIIKDFKLTKNRRNVLLINPPIYDCSDFKLEYCQPTGLLKISSYLKQYNSNVELIDCLKDNIPRQKIGEINRGKVKIPLYHFGDGFDLLSEKLFNLQNRPDEIYLTAFATYWYKSIRDTISLIRKIFPASKIIVGGIYPTLLPEHAEKNLGADIIVVGEIMGLEYRSIDMGNYYKPNFMGLKPSKGCPNKCKYCAQNIINSNGLSYQNPTAIVDEIEYNTSINRIHQYYIFSENFLYNQTHFKDFLNEIISRKLNIQIGAPKGMEPRLLSKEILSLMKKAGWYGLRLALETVDEKHKKRLGRRYNNKNDYESAIRYALDSGFSSSEIGTFLLYGTPFEKIEDIKETADYIAKNNSYIIPMAFTPVPGSELYNENFEYLRNKDLTDLMGRLYPFSELNGYNINVYLEVEKYFARLNNTTALNNNGKLELSWLETKYAGAFTKSEISFAMNL
jgi:radical SAM superfamily enzyme YgiQ (UPF0313 family)